MRHHLPLTLAVGTLLGTHVHPVSAQPEEDEGSFALGEIVVVGRRPDSLSSVGGSVVTREQNWRFEKISLDQALNTAPGVSTTVRGRRNEFDVLVRGFDRLQVPLMVDGVRIYLPADNRIDFGRFLTGGVAEVQIQKGYASVLDGPGAMGGAINIVTIKPTEELELEGGVSAGGRSDVEDWNAFLIGGSRQERFYVHGSIAYADRESWSMSADYAPPPGSLEDGGERVNSYSEDWHVNLKVGFTPSENGEYTLNYIKQEGEKGSPLNVYNNPPVPRGSFWLWPYWDVQNVSFLTSTELGGFYLKTKSYYNTFENGLSSYDDITYTTQSQPYAFFSPYDDDAYGASVELGTTQLDANTLRFALHYRSDDHTEQQTNRPTHPTLRFAEPVQQQSQYTWSVAIENTFHASSALEVVAGLSYEEYEVTKAEEFNSAVSPTIFEYPKGGSDGVNWQAAVIHRYNDRGQFHVGISDRGRFPTFFELYSTRFGTATPNPDLGPERATNLEVGWETATTGGARFGGALFYNDVEDLIQTVVLPNTTTQAQNVGNGRFYGLEVVFDVAVARGLSIGGNYTYMDRKIEDALQPNLRPEGVPDNEVLLYASWQPTARFTLTPSIEAADDRWSPVNPPPAFPYVMTGAYTLVNFDLKYSFANDLELAVGAKNLLDDNYELAWGFPQPGRSVYTKFRMAF